MKKRDREIRRESKLLFSKLLLHLCADWEKKVEGKKILLFFFLAISPIFCRWQQLFFVLAWFSIGWQTGWQQQYFVFEGHFHQGFTSALTFSSKGSMSDLAIFVLLKRKSFFQCKYTWKWNPISSLLDFQFKRMLNKELSHFSESKSGNQISEYICSTFLGRLSCKLFFRVLIRDHISY